MKKARRQGSAAVSRTGVAETAPRPLFVWWPWAAALAALFVVFETYGPALNGPFVLDDLYLMFANPRAATAGFSAWIGGIRPLLMTSYWVNYQWGGSDPYLYHATNVLLHFLGAVVIAWIAARLLEFAGVAGRQRTLLAIFTGGLFLLHPLQTESVAYIASRSEVLSVLLYMSAFAVFLYRRTEKITLLRSLAVLVLFAAAVSTKEHTLTLPFLLVLADFFWGLGGVRKNGTLYALLAAGGAAGAWFVWRVLRFADTAGFQLRDLSPATYFFTQCRVVWSYIRLFFLPFGQNADPDVPVSTGILDHGAWLGLLALVALVGVAWYYRKRFPLAAFGMLVFLLLLAPTSSIVPIRDVLAERRLYLPFLGLALVCVEFLRRLKFRDLAWTAAAVLSVCAVLTYQRSAVWGDSLALWQDTVAKSPRKWRPRFQLAHAYYLLGQCPQAAESFEIASKIGPQDVPLLIDWGLSLDCAGRPSEAVAKLEQAARLEPTAHVYSQIGMVYGKQRKMQEALEALALAEKADPRFEMTYVYKGNVYEASGDKGAAAGEYRRALQINPSNQPALEALGRVSR